MKIVPVKTNEELEYCLEVRRKVFVEEKGVPKEIEIDKFDKDASCCEHFIVFENEKAVGAFRIRRLDKETVRLQRFCFLSECRGKGFGKKALDFIDEYYKKEGIKLITADAKFEVSPFYEKCGYAVVSDVFEEAGIPHVKIEKEIR